MIRIAVASGKGGTGKTTVATSLALVLTASQTCFLDCDVEAPNAHLFLKPSFDRVEEVGILIPRIDEMACSYCGKCAEVCQFHAIAVIGKTTLVFPELCHGCGSCSLICPEKAIHEQMNEIGILESGITPSGISFARGLINIGQPMSVPIIRQLKNFLEFEHDIQTLILDAPPGTSCPVVETIRGVDFVLLVTEPTPFGLHDLKLAVQLTRELKLTTGVIINRDGIGNREVDDFCEQQDIPILMRIPMNRKIAEALAGGQTLIEAMPEYRSRFENLYTAITSLVLSEKGVKA